ncbi:MAG: hypothetical protein RIT14_2182 [Pseudomonadota bacterium]
MTQPGDDIAALLAARPRRLPRPGWLLLAAGAGLALALGLWLALRPSDTAVTYLTEPATLGALTVTVTATGTVQPTTQVDVSSELSGTLASVEVDFNDTVRVGQVLARLDTAKLAAQLTNARAGLAAAEGRLASARATAREAEANLTAQRELDRRGITASRDLITVEAAHARALAALQIAEADLSLAQANLTLTQTDLDKSDIRSPIDGIVLNRTAEAGQIVASALNAPVLFTLAEDLSRMELRVDIDEADIGRIAPGNPARFTVDAYPGRDFPATITQVRYAPETTESVVTYKAILSVENPDGLLRPGMTATATITVAEVDKALLVPNAALRYAPPTTAEKGRAGSGLLGLILPRRAAGAAGGRSDGRTVWVLREGAPVAVPVTPGESDGRLTVVTATEAGSLTEGDAVITDQTGSAS